jgi:hypothetical protein
VVDKVSSSLEVRDAFFEWLTSVTIGIIPLLAHFFMSIADPIARGTISGWITDILFVAIATAGTSAVSVFARFAKRKIRSFRLGPSAIFLMTVTILLLVFAAMIYGAVACGHVGPFSLLLALGLMFGSVIASLAYELSIVTGIALSPLPEEE